MLRPIRFIPLLAVIVGGALGFQLSSHQTVQAQVGCGNCHPQWLGNGNTLINVNNGAVNVCFQPGSFTPDEIEGFKKGFKYWDDVLNSDSGQLPWMAFSFDQSGTCSVSILKTTLFNGTSTVAQGNGNGGNGGPSNVIVNEQKLNDTYTPDQWSWYMAHEIGHLMGIAHVSQTDINNGCNLDSTVMMPTINSGDIANRGAIPSMLCNDGAALTEGYSSSGGSTSVSDESASNSNDWYCTDVYTVWTFWSVNGSGQWYVTGQIWQYNFSYNCYQWP